MENKNVKAIQKKIEKNDFSYSLGKARAAAMSEEARRLENDNKDLRELAKEKGEPTEAPEEVWDSETKTNTVNGSFADTDEAKWPLWRRIKENEIFIYLLNKRVNAVNKEMEDLEKKNESLAVQLKSLQESA
ncbi:hypothetical protein ACFL35_13035 [Candidatus Riflebacteria bacterium]